jgi:hypothetical protein
MVPVEQDRTGANGRCWPACIASILEIPLSEIPEFSTDPDQWLSDVQEWLAGLGLYYVQVKPDDPAMKAAFAQDEPLYHAIEGLSPRGGQHAVVGDRGRMVHDPHPKNDGTGQGLVNVACYGLLCARFA